MKCQLCEQFYKDYPLREGEDGQEHQLEEGVSMAPARCAFEQGTFSTDNWNCETMNELRERCDFLDMDDMSAGSFCVIRIPREDYDENLQLGYIVMTWYKRRGKTGQAYVVCDDEMPEPLKLETAEFVLSQKDQKVRPVT